MLAALALLVSLLPLASPAQDGSGTRTPLARVELTGPLRSAALDFPDGSGATLALSLLDGEQRSLTVPLPTPPGLTDAVPDVRLDGTGSARFAGWVGEDRARLAADWERLPPGLRRRPRPPAPEQPLDAGPPPAALLVACAALLLVLRWRRRATLALVLGAVGAVGAFALAARPAPAGLALTLLEGEGSSGAWLLLQSARGRLGVEPVEALWVQTRPPRAVLRARVEARSGGPLWELSAPGATIDRLEQVPAGGLTRDGPNGLGDLAETWLREPDGSWTRRGPWRLGERLPEALDGAGEPPGWINPALPMGVAILVGRRADAGPAAGAAWVRLVGF